MEMIMEKHNQIQENKRGKEKWNEYKSKIESERERKTSMLFLSFVLNLIQKHIVIEIRDYENFKRKSNIKRKITYGSENQLTKRRKTLRERKLHKKKIYKRLPWERGWLLERKKILFYRRKNDLGKEEI